ncbi:GlcG/HbpS family heme-binding protein [Undibacterium luofuense]|uniref:Heme-binding protein n=1 Tax=Undibacterium luofuense TaxID=2828733 RepID=A0A941DKC9_9BURK|nr:heme-binding protein [Undibacterium luofuense]MBR7781634.1 heme-binding protein [Undibacterium luofuense]
MKTLLKAMLLVMISRNASAQTTPGIVFDDAMNLARHAQQHCRTLHRDIAVSVVDASGQALLIQRAESVGPHNLEAARRKAYTALSTRQPTLQLGRQARSQPDTAALQYLPELLLLGGGVPIRRDGQVVGAIGVAGGGGPENDDACARAAADLIR